MVRSRFLRAFVAAIAVAGAAALRAATEPVLAGDTPIAPPVVTVLPANDQEKAKILDLLAQAAAEKDATKLADALKQLNQRKHVDFVPEVRKLLTATDEATFAAAISAAAAQDMKDIEKDVRKWLRTKPKKGAAGTVAGAQSAACIDYLGRLGFTGDEEVILDDHLKLLMTDERKLKQPWAREMIRAAIHCLGKAKYKPAVPYLIDEMVAEPVPANPNDPKNPPATYWEVRRRLWEEYEGWARWALKETTGQQFRDVREWQAWMKQQDKKAFK